MLEFQMHVQTYQLPLDSLYKETMLVLVSVDTQSWKETKRE